MRPHPRVVEHLAQLNGARARGSVIPIGGEDMPVEALFGIDFPPADILGWIGSVSERSPGGWVPFARLVGAFLLASDAGRIYYWDPQLDEMSLAFESPARAVNAMRLSDDDEGDSEWLNELAAMSVAEIVADPALVYWSGITKRFDVLAELRESYPGLLGDFFRGACSMGHRDLVSDLLQNDASSFSINATDAEGATALMLAAGIGDIDVVDLLLAAGADPTMQNNDGSTAVHYASPYLGVKNVLRAAIANWPP